MIVLIVISIVVAAIAIWWISTSNDFKRKEIQIDESLSGIEVSLTNRFDKLTKLLDVTKGYAAHEKEVLAQVISMRKGMTAGELSECSKKMDVMAAHINAVAEAYPELRSAELFKELQSGIRTAEANLQAARRLYNSNVRAYNTAIAVFPSSMVANSQNLRRRDFFVAEEAKKADVQMKF